MPLIREADRDAIAGDRPDLLDQPIVELAGPLALEEGDDLGASVDELRAVSPAAVLGVGVGDPLGLAGIPGVLCRSHFLGGRLGGERRQGWATRHRKPPEHVLSALRLAYGRGGSSRRQGGPAPVGSGVAWGILTAALLARGGR